MAKDVSIGVSVFTLTALSGDRYVAIVSPLRRHSSSTARRHTCILAAAIWIAAIALAIPDAVISEVQVLELDDSHVIKVRTCNTSEGGPAPGSDTGSLGVVKARLSHPTRSFLNQAVYTLRQRSPSRTPLNPSKLIC